MRQSKDVGVEEYLELGLFEAIQKQPEIVFLLFDGVTSENDEERIEYTRFSFTP